MLSVTHPHPPTNPPTHPPTPTHPHTLLLCVRAVLKRARGGTGCGDQRCWDCFGRNAGVSRLNFRLFFFLLAHLHMPCVRTDKKKTCRVRTSTYTDATKRLKRVMRTPHQNGCVCVCVCMCLCATLSLRVCAEVGVSPAKKKGERRTHRIKMFVCLSFSLSRFLRLSLCVSLSVYTHTHTQAQTHTHTHRHKHP
jgi:hypothetical protein